MSEITYKRDTGQPLSLSERMALKRETRIKTAPKLFKSLLERALTGKCSPRMAIKAQCLECVGFDRAAITDCTAYACPLWHYRPYQTKDSVKESDNET